MLTKRGHSAVESLPHIKQIHQSLLDAKHHDGGLLKRFGAWLRQEREQHGLTATELARRIGVSQVLITRVEHANAVLSEDKLSKVFEVLQLGANAWHQFMESGQEPTLQELAQFLHAQLQAARVGCPSLIGEFGQHVRYHRCERHWTEGELALRVGVTKQTICGVEQGRMVPSAALIGHLAEELDLSLRQWHMPSDSSTSTDLIAQALNRLWGGLSDGDKMLLLGMTERLSGTRPLWEPKRDSWDVPSPLPDLMGLDS
ncbi:MAG: helix-turn-helix transcriptional regulator [Sulfobacillus thermotolerans]|nr:helix-turn-helix transcriptional regulator [Sulfobacillus thermotolerans]